MKKTKSVLLLIPAILLLLFTAACGASGKDAAVTTATTLNQQEVQQQATAQPSVVEQSKPEADATAGVDTLLGEWVDVTAADRFAKITKTDSGYEYEDNEGKYPAAFENDKLMVKATETDTVEVYIDAASGHLLAVLNDNMSEFARK